MVSFNCDYDFGFEDAPEPQHVRVFRKLSRDWPEADRERMAAALAGPDFRANLQTLLALIAGLVARHPELAAHLTPSLDGGFVLPLLKLVEPVRDGMRTIGPEGLPVLLREVIAAAVRS